MLAELNRWMSANYGALVRQARRNSVALTG